MSWICEDVKKHMHAYLDGILPPQDREAFEAHLEGCASCRTELDEHSMAWKLLDRFEEIEPSPFFAARTLREVRIRNEAERAHRIRRIVTATAAALMIGASLVFYFLATSEATGPGTGTDEVAVETGLLENLDLIEDLDFLVEHGEELELAMEYDLYEMLGKEESL
jgi:anti-sigma factor RsiW